MHTNETKDQFLEMRAKGLSLARIASDIHVSQRTLVAWNRQLAPDIRALRAVHLEALHEQTLASRQANLARLAKVQANVEAAITERDFSWVDSDKLVRIYLDLRHEIRDLRAADLSPLTGGPNSISPPLEPATSAIPRQSPSSEAKSRLVGTLRTPHSPIPPPPLGAGIPPAKPNQPLPAPSDAPPSPSASATTPVTQDAVDRGLWTVDCGRLLPASVTALRRCVSAFWSPLSVFLLPRCLSAPLLRHSLLTFSVALFLTISPSTTCTFPGPRVVQFCATSDTQQSCPQRKPQARTSKPHLLALRPLRPLCETLGPQLSVERAAPDRFGNMVAEDVFCAGQVGDAAGDSQDAAVASLVLSRTQQVA
jgi:hypothetical protein